MEGNLTHDGKPYIKTYKLLYIWIIVFPILWIALITVLSVVAPEIFDGYGELVTRGNLFITDLFVLLLMVIIYRTERIYWINGMSYKKAAAMSSVSRRDYARGHLRNFLYATLLYLFYAGIASGFSLPTWTDYIVFLVSIGWAAIATMKIKPEN